MELIRLVKYLDEYLKVPGHPDYPNALNGLQVARRKTEVTRIGGAVDSALATLKSAADAEVDLLIVHHGLFWSGLEPVTGRRYEKLRLLVDADIALYSSHLPLDGHPGVGNAAAMARALSMQVESTFGEYEGAPVGWRGFMTGNRQSLQNRLIGLIDGPVIMIPGGPEQIQSVAIVTGAGGSLIGTAAAEGIDTLITGEGAHHTYHDAMELGVNVFYAGHYATETFGVRALGKHLEEEFRLTFEFIDHPTGL